MQIPGSKVTIFVTSAIFEIIALKTAEKLVSSTVPSKGWGRHLEARKLLISFSKGE